MKDSSCLLGPIITDHAAQAVKALRDAAPIIDFLAQYHGPS
jgi:hypothetical protein